MLEAFRVLWDSLRDLWQDVWTVAVVNLLWLLSQVFILPGPPATLALFYYANRLAHGEVADVRDFLSAFRRYFFTGWRWGFANLLVMAVLIGDTILTGRLSQSPVARFSQGFYLAALGVWLFIQLFALPFLFEQEKDSLWQAWRNGAVMIGRSPGFSLALGALLVLTLGLGAALFMLSGAAGAVLAAVAGNRAVISRLEANRDAPPRERHPQKKAS